MAHIAPIRIDELLLVNAGSTAVGSTVKEIRGENNGIIVFNLIYPIFSEISEKITISRKISHSWRLIRLAEILAGDETIS
jgi:translation initiation factor 2 gamma subunit (eIF-2gamma)